MTSVPDRAGPALEVAGIWQVGDAVAMVRRRHDAGVRWALPGGAVAAGETLAESVVRHVDACLALDALCGPFVGWGEVVEHGEHRVTMYFEVVVLDGPPPDRRTGALGAGAATVEARAVPDWEVAELPVVAGLAEFLADQGIIDLVV